MERSTSQKVAETPLILEWDFEKNSEIGLTPEETTIGSSRKAFWNCKNGHSWSASTSSRNRGFGCPKCSNKLAISGFNDLLTLRPDKSSYWDYERNYPLTPDQFMVGSRRSVSWFCEDCDNSWQQSIRTFTNLRKWDCLKCSSIATMAPHLVEEWGEDGVDPYLVYYRSSRRVTWRCHLGHTWVTTVARRFDEQKDCPTCLGFNLNMGVNDLSTKFPKIAEEWDHSRNSLSPDEVTYSSHEIVYWKCKSGHSWKQSINSRTQKLRQVCQKCFPHGYSLLEKSVHDFIKDSFPNLSLESKYRGIEGVFEVDIFIPALNLGVEVNGTYWHSDEVLKSRGWESAAAFHRFKAAKSLDSGVKLVFIWENDWKNRQEHIKRQLVRFIDSGGIDCSESLLKLENS